MSNELALIRISENPLSTSPLSEKLTITKMVLSSALFSSLASVAYPIKQTIILHYIGHNHDSYYLTALGFSFNWVGIWIQVLNFSLTLGYSSLVAQALGGKNFHRAGFLTQQIFILLGIITLATSLFICLCEPVFMAMFDDEEMSAAIVHMCRLFIPSCIGGTIFQVFRCFLLSFDIYEWPTFILLCSILLQVPLSYYFIEAWDMGFEGAGISIGISEFLAAFFVYLYYRWRNPCPDAVIRFNRNSFFEFKEFCVSIFTHGLTVYLECVTFSITFLVIMFAHDYDIFAAHSSMMNYVSLIQMLFDGLALSANTYMSMSAGYGSVNRAKKFAHFSLIIFAVFISVAIIFSLVMEDWIIEFYSEDRTVDLYSHEMLMFYIAGMTFDNLATLLGFMLRAMGQEKYVMWSFIIVYDVIGLTLSIYLGSYLDLKHYGIWGALDFSFVTVFVILVYKIWTLKWEDEVNKIYNDQKEGERLLNEIDVSVELSRI